MCSGGERFSIPQSSLQFNKTSFPHANEEAYFFSEGIAQLPK